MEPQDSMSDTERRPEAPRFNQFAGYWALLLLRVVIAAAVSAIVFVSFNPKAPVWWICIIVLLFMLKLIASQLWQHGRKPKLAQRESRHKKEASAKSSTEHESTDFEAGDSPGGLRRVLLGLVILCVSFAPFITIGIVHFKALGWVSGLGVAIGLGLSWLIAKNSKKEGKGGDKSESTFNGEFPDAKTSIVIFASAYIVALVLLVLWGFGLGPLSSSAVVPSSHTHQASNMPPDWEPYRLNGRRLAKLEASAFGRMYRASLQGSPTAVSLDHRLDKLERHFDLQYEYQVGATPELRLERLEEALQEQEQKKQEEAEKQLERWNRYFSTEERARPPLLVPLTAAEIAKKVRKSIVQVSRDGSRGSGVVTSWITYSSDGTPKGQVLLTNYHVIRDSMGRIFVDIPDIGRIEATLVRTDPDRDLAALTVPYRTDFVPLEWGKLSDLNVGDEVSAFGHPQGLSQTMTRGIVSALPPIRIEGEVRHDCLQTDAAINPGNSGGALVDPYGRLIGINTFKLIKNRGDFGLGFAVHIDEVSKFFAEWSGE